MAMITAVSKPVTFGIHFRKANLWGSLCLCKTDLENQVSNQWITHTCSTVIHNMVPMAPWFPRSFFLKEPILDFPSLITATGASEDQGYLWVWRELLLRNRCPHHSKTWISQHPVNAALGSHFVTASQRSHFVMMLTICLRILKVITDLAWLGIPPL